MEDYMLGAVESKFASIIWEHAPVTTKELTRLCEQELGWKRTTTYTVLKSYVERSFLGSLPSFLTAFTSGRKLSDKEIAEIKQIIENSK